MNVPLKVLYVTHYGDLYGANRSMLDMILELRSKYHIIPCVLLNRHGDLEKELQRNGIEYIYGRYYACAVPDNGKILVYIKRMIKRVIRIGSYAAIIKKLSNDFDIVHSNSSVVDIGYYISRKFHRTHIWHIREFGWEDCNLVQIDGIRKIKERYENADCVIAVSNAVKKKIAGIDEKAVVDVVYDGVKIPERYEKKICADHKVHFCIVGAVYKNKNQMEAVKAVNELVKRGYDDFSLHIIGDGDAKGELFVLKKYIEENHLEKYVELTGYRYDVEMLLRTMDIGIMSSYKEAFGRVTIEYMSNYMPVIGTVSGGTKELVRNGDNGFLYNLGNPMDLMEKMERFINEPHLIKDMGLRARDFSERFSAGINAHKIYRIYMKAQGSMH
ncbi:MAG: glycosyltransferase family 4 protein [Eubacterium sp.]|nr:glycosyltransferase family 4 protein [Eubacterium sp.]